MIKKLNKPLFNSFLLSFSFLFVLLVIFFLYAVYDNRSFFYILTVVLLICAGFLIYDSIRLGKSRSTTNLHKQDYLENNNLLQAEITRELAKAESFRKKINNYSELKTLTEHLSLCYSLADTSHALSNQVSRLFDHAETTTILYVFHSRTGELGISSSQRGQMQINLKNKKGDMFDQWIVKTMHPLLIEDTQGDFRFDMDQVKLEESRPIRSLIGVPLMVGDKALGILRVDSPKGNHFTAEDLRFLSTIGSLGAIAIENAQLFERVEDLAIKDSLTGLYLRRHLLERMGEEISRGLRREKELSFLMIDLDHFKAYNDRFGHVAGDIVLRTVALILADHFREPGDLVCRYGGEEFCVLLPDCSKQKAISLAEKLRERIERQTIILRRQKTQMTVSIGVAAFPKDAKMQEELIHAADQAMYQAKKTGRNRVCLAL